MQVLNLLLRLLTYGTIAWTLYEEHNRHLLDLGLLNRWDLLGETSRLDDLVRQLQQKCQEIIK